MLARAAHDPDWDGDATDQPSGPSEKLAWCPIKLTTNASCKRPNCTTFARPMRTSTGGESGPAT